MQRLISFFVILTGAPAFAADPVVEVDKNGDGLMSAPEVRAVFPEITPDLFAKIDTDNDGALNDAEMVAALEQGLLTAPSDG